MGYDLYAIVESGYLYKDSTAPSFYFSSLLELNRPHFFIQELESKAEFGIPSDIDRYSATFLLNRIYKGKDRGILSILKEDKYTVRDEEGFELTLLTGFSSELSGSPKWFDEKENLIYKSSVMSPMFTDYYGVMRAYTSLLKYEPMSHLPSIEALIDLLKEYQDTKECFGRVIFWRS